MIQLGRVRRTRFSQTLILSGLFLSLFFLSTAYAKLKKPIFPERGALGLTQCLNTCAKSRAGIFTTTLNKRKGVSKKFRKCVKACRTKRPSSRKGIRFLNLKKKRMKKKSKPQKVSNDIFKPLPKSRGKKGRKKFKPFSYKDLTIFSRKKGARGRSKKLKGSDILVIPIGPKKKGARGGKQETTEMTGDEVLDTLNPLEKELNERGYSLRPEDKRKLPVMEVEMPTDEFNKQMEKAERNRIEQRPIDTTFEIPRFKDTKGARGKSKSRRSRFFRGKQMWSKKRVSKKKWRLQVTKLRKALKKARKRGARGRGKSTGESQCRKTKNKPCGQFKETYGRDKKIEFGSKKILKMGLYPEMTIRADHKKVSIDAKAEAKVWAFNSGGKLLMGIYTTFEGHNTDKGRVIATGKVKVFGAENELWEKIDQQGWEDEVDKVAIDDKWGHKIHFNILGIPLHLAFGIGYKVGVEMTAKLKGAQAGFAVRPYIESDAFAELAIDVGIAEAGVRGVLTLLDAEATFSGYAALIGEEGKKGKSGKLYLVYDVAGDLAYETLSGEVLLYAQLGICPLCKKATVKLFDWDGFGDRTRIFRKADKIYLAGKPKGSVDSKLDDDVSTAQRGEMHGQEVKHDYGEMGKAGTCPANSYIYAFRQQIQAKSCFGIKGSCDDAGLVAVEMRCRDKYNTDTGTIRAIANGKKQTYAVTPPTRSGARWSKWARCKPGRFVDRFQARTTHKGFEKGGTRKRMDTDHKGILELKLRCSDGKWLQPKVKGMGIWGGTFKKGTACEKGFAFGSFNIRKYWIQTKNRTVGRRKCSSVRKFVTRCKRKKGKKVFDDPGVAGIILEQCRKVVKKKPSPCVCLEGERDIMALGCACRIKTVSPAKIYSLPSKKCDRDNACQCELRISGAKGREKSVLACTPSKGKCPPGFKKKSRGKNRKKAVTWCQTPIKLRRSSRLLIRKCNPKKETPWRTFGKKYYPKRLATCPYWIDSKRAGLYTTGCYERCSRLKAQQKKSCDARCAKGKTRRARRDTNRGAGGGGGRNPFRGAGGGGGR